MAPGNRRVDGDGFIHADVHRELYVLIEDAVIEFPAAVGALGPIDHRAFDHVRIVGPRGMDGVGGDVLAAGRRIELEVLPQQRFVLVGPGLDVVVPRQDPRVLPQVEPESPIPGAGQDLVLHAYSHLQCGATLLRADVDRSLVDAGLGTGRNVQGNPYWPDRAAWDIEPPEGFEPIRHEKDRVRRVASPGSSTIRVIRQHVANEIHVEIGLAQHRAVGTGEVTGRNPYLFHRIPRPDQNLRIQPFTLPAGIVPQAGFFGQIWNLAPHVQLIGRTKR